MSEPRQDGSGTGRGEPGGRRRAGGLWGAVGLTLLASALAGCASLAVRSVLGPPPVPEQPAVVRYEWAGRRGDELVVAYEVWGVRRGRVEPRWTALDLRALAGAPGLEAPRVGTADMHAGPRPDPASVAPVRIITLPEGPAGAAPVAAGPGAPAAGAAVTVHARPGRSPKFIVVATDPTGDRRAAAWALNLGDPLPPTEPLPRALARLVATPVAVAVDLVTLPLQLLLGLTGLLTLH